MVTSCSTDRNNEGRGNDSAARARGRARRAWPRSPPGDRLIAAERSPEFRELIKKKRAFVLPATIFYLAWFFGFILLAGYAPDFMGESVIDDLTVGYVLALTQFIMVWVLTAWYLKIADRVFDPLAANAAQRAREAGRSGGEEVAR